MRRQTSILGLRLCCDADILVHVYAFAFVQKRAWARGFHKNGKDDLGGRNWREKGVFFNEQAVHPRQEPLVALSGKLIAQNTTEQLSTCF